jgi:hypothetical protein
VPDEAWTQEALREGPVIFPALTKTTEYQHDGDEHAFVMRTTEQTYDSYGNVTAFEDHGGPGGEDDIEPKIAYSGDDGLCRGLTSPRCRGRSRRGTEAPWCASERRTCVARFTWTWRHLVAGTR